MVMLDMGGEAAGGADKLRRRVVSSETIMATGFPADAVAGAGSAVTAPV